MLIPFTKMHGCGNDYLYVDVTRYMIDDPARLAVLWSDRHKGIGSDGLVLIGQPTVPDADYSMRIFNADGSEAMMCGNASRCIGKYLYEHHMTDRTAIRLQTLSGVKTLQLHIFGGVVESVTVDMGVPTFDDKALFDSTLTDSLSDSISQSECDDETPLPIFVSMGNPHYVVFTQAIDQVKQAGSRLEHHPAFPQRCNIEFVRLIGDGCLRVRVWERGSGITMACGTGACAVAVAAAVRKLADRTSQVMMDGGTLSIEWRESDNHVYMTGPAEFICDGTAPAFNN